MMSEAIDALNRTAEIIGAQNQQTQNIFIVVLVLIVIMSLIGLGVLIVRIAGTKAKTEGEIRSKLTEAEIEADKREDSRFDKMISALVDMASEFNATNRNLSNILESLKAAQQTTLGVAQTAVGGIGTLQTDVTQIKGHVEAIEEILITIREVREKIIEVKLVVEQVFPAQANPSQHIDKALSEVGAVELAAKEEQKRTTAELSSAPKADGEAAA